MRALENRKFHAAILLHSLMLCGAIAQGGNLVTNEVPTNLFLTDDGFSVRYRDGHHLVAAASKIKEAESSPECRSADQDPEGNWGSATDGFQVSLRISKQTYTNGEPVMATVLIRNVSDKELKYYRSISDHWPFPVDIPVVEDGKTLGKKTDAGIQSLDVREQRLYAYTQHKFVVNITRFYDLTKGGVFVLQASYHMPVVGAQGMLDLTSQKVSISVAGAAGTGH